jgi:hypothetical protein
MKTSEYGKAHYEANKAKYIASAKATKKKLRDWYNEYKASLACSQCGENHPACIEFHHRDPSKKDFTIGESLYRMGKQSIIDEIAKCDVLCSNCHRKLHYKG